MTTVYGIPNCDSFKLARAWLAEHHVLHRFHDYKKQGVPADLLHRWMKTLGWEPLLNRKGATWRNLDAQTQISVVDAASAWVVMQTHSSVIKRPVVMWPSGAVTVGFSAAEYARQLP